MIEVESDRAKNLIVVRYHGHVTATDTAAHVAKLKTAIDTMQPAFGLLADLSDLELMDVDRAPHIAQVMDYANACGVGIVVRVIPDPRRDIGMQIMSIFHYRGNV